MARKVYDRSEFFGSIAEGISGVPKDLQAKMEFYKRHPAEFVSEQCATITDIDPPHGKFRVVKMKLFQAQTDLVNRMITFDEEHDDVYVDDTHLEKSRQMGMSWILADVFGVWAPMFWPAVQGLFISRKEDEVDDGGNRSTTKCLLGKVRFVYEHLDEWLKEMAPFEFKFLHVTNRANDSWIMGESANPNAGRGGTFKYVVADEWAFVPQSEAVYSGISRACPRGKILNSTPFGTGNHYARIKRMHTHGEDTGYKFIRLHWSQNPMYARGMSVNPDTGRLTSPWYESQIKTMTPEQVARELEISYTASMSGMVYPEFNVDVDVMDKEHAYLADYDPRKGPVYVGWDFGLNDPTALLLIQKNELGGYDIFNELQMEGQPIENFVPYIQSWQNSTYPGSDFIHWGDIAGTQKEQVTGSSVIETLAMSGIYVNSKKQAVQDGIRKIRLMHQNRQIRVHPRCLTYIECKTNHHYPLDPTGRPREGIEVPYHDWTSHICSAERYVVMGVFDEGELRAEDFIMGGSRDGEAEWTSVSSDDEIFGLSW
jgi:hypothetical protein